MKKIVDYFSYYDDTCKELLKLRVKLLDSVVDHFIICESNKTHSGIPIEYKLRDRIKEYDLPNDKITIIDLDIPDDLNPSEVDYWNSGTNSHNINSVKARTRERLQRDAIIHTLNNFDNDTFFIVGDCDEIINPNCVDFITNIVKNSPNSIIKIPLVYLEGRADLRMYDRDTGLPKSWDLSLFICQKKHLLQTNPINIRCNYKNPFPIVYCTQDDNIIQDLGWHFSWMGGSEIRSIKRNAFCHYQDELSYIQSRSYNTSVAKKLIETPLGDGSIPPSLETDSVLRLYDSNLLPKVLLEDSEIYSYMFGKV